MCRVDVLLAAGHGPLGSFISCTTVLTCLCVRASRHRTGRLCLGAVHKQFVFLAENCVTISLHVQRRCCLSINKSAISSYTQPLAGVAVSFAHSPAGPRSIFPRLKKKKNVSSTAPVQLF
ncbi:unnamed protein product, partial [Ectocarpus sp. 4 AP-2014]